jgi:cysteine dioxygenase
MNNLINKIKLLIKEEPNIALKDKNKIKILLESSKIDINDIKKFVKIDETINYTRNLISTDNKSYALILIWWNKGKYSPIHDHPSDGCWVKIISGTVNEIQYECKNNKLIERSNKILTSGVTYMDNYIGLHKVGNPDINLDAITLHLYLPPYNKCKIWYDINNTNNFSISNINYH